MDRRAAEEAVKLLHAVCDNACGAADALRDHLPPETFKQFARDVGRIAAIVTLDLVPVIGRVHRDLDTNFPMRDE